MSGRAEDRVRPVDAVRAHLFEDDGSIPNNPKLPLLVYPGAVATSGADPAAAFEEIFAANGWSGSWRNGIYPFPHYHSTAHEVLGIARGEAKVRFGGDRGIVLDVQAGDVVVIPAGVGHQNLGASGDLLVVGAYPGGAGFDLCRGGPDDRPRVLDNIRQVALPAADPVFGRAGPLLAQWREG
ncbi:MAG TPA: cupin domain-containing protein [Geminicoccaceae bacterium]|nr:cupin domain-containing protein [Geminicoccaceae bacterium]